MLAPLLADAGKKINPALPYIIFSTVNIITGLLCLLLPETNNIPLPNTIQEAIDMEKYESKICGNLILSIKLFLLEFSFHL